MKSKAQNPFMQLAIDEALQGVAKGHGGPFGSVVIKDGTSVGSGHNMVISSLDSTAHGEIAAIRDAERRLNTYDLSGCVLYTTGEPCPMCLFACLWANIDRVYYGCTIADNGLLGFRDKRFDDLMGGRERLNDYLVCIDREACLELFGIYRDRFHETY